MNVKIIALDYDGTLLSDKKTILPETLSALKKAHDNGIILLPATGRMLWGIYQTCIPEFDYAIACNGAAVYNLKTKECIIEHTLEKEKALYILDKIEKFDISIDVFIDGNAYKDKSDADMIEKLHLSPEMTEFMKKSRIYVNDLRKFINEENHKIQKFTLNFTPDENGVGMYRTDVFDILKGIPDITVVCGGMNNLEITEKGVSKGKALLEFGELMDIKKDEIMAFGDSENDLEMIKNAGMGIAMKNSIPEVLEAANFITLSNNDNGIAYAIDKFIF